MYAPLSSPPIQPAPKQKRTALVIAVIGFALIGGIGLGSVANAPKAATIDTAAGTKAAPGLSKIPVTTAAPTTTTTAAPTTTTTAVKAVGSAGSAAEERFVTIMREEYSADRSTLISAGYAACDLVTAAGGDGYEVLLYLADMKDPEKAGYTMGAAVAFLCPEYESVFDSL